MYRLFFLFVPIPVRILFGCFAAFFEDGGFAFFYIGGIDALQGRVEFPVVAKVEEVDEVGTHLQRQIADAHFVGERGGLPGLDALYAPECRNDSRR